MSEVLIEVLSEHDELLVENVVRQLDVNSASRYHELGTGRLRDRVNALAGAFRKALASRPGAFVSYIEGVARERNSEGFVLGEVQRALRVFEEGVWRLVAVHVPREEQIDCLARVTGIIGAAKDQLAWVYLQLLEEARDPARRAQGSDDRIMSGTDSPPITEEDRPPVDGLARHVAFSRSFGRHGQSTT